MPKLTVKNLKTQEAKSYKLPQDHILFGRVATCDVELAEKSVSRKHAEIVKAAEDYFLVDLKSGNGTQLNGKKIRPVERHLIKPGDLIGIESYEIQFELLEDVSQKTVDENTDTDILEVKMLKKVLGALNKDSEPSLEVLNGVAEGKKVYFTEELQEIEIGREPQCALSIDDPVISRNHAKLIRKWGGIVLVDLGSRNGSYVNHEKVDEKLLKDGDKILLGTIKILYRNPQDINIEAIGQDIARKKREAVLRETELIQAVKRQQEEDQKRQLEAQEALEQAEEVVSEEVDENSSEEAALETPPDSDEANNLPVPVEEAAHQPAAAVAVKPGLSGLEKIMVGLGGVVLILAVLAIVWVFVGD